MWLQLYKNQKWDRYVTERHNIHAIIPGSSKVSHNTKFSPCFSNRLTLDRQCLSFFGCITT